GAGDPGPARSRRAFAVEEYRGDNEARPFGRASCSWQRAPHPPGAYVIARRDQPLPRRFADRASMEPRGCNRWQTVAIAAVRTRIQAKTVAMRCDPLPEAAHGKEGSTVRVRQRGL